MPMISGLKAVIFDLDGVLVNTSQYHAQAWGDLVRSLGYQPVDDLEEKVRGISRLASLQIALGEHAAKYTADELAELAERKNACYLAATQNISPADLFPGALALFASLQQAGIKIVLGSASKNARPILDALEITQYFDAIADGFTYKHGKPHPDVFLTGARMVGLSPAECIVVEDATAGINAALDGGFVTVGMGTLASLRHAHLFINNLTEIDADRLICLHAKHRSDRWTVTREGRHPEREASLNTLFCTGNGRLGIRGHLSELPGGESAGTLLAGFFDTITRPAHDPDKWSLFLKYWGVPELATDKQIEASIINCPDLLASQWSIDGEEIDLTQGELRAFTRSLDLASGMFVAEAHWISPAGKELLLTQRRFADMAQTDRVFVQYAIEPLNFSGALTLHATIDTTPTNNAEDHDIRLYTVEELFAIGDRGVGVRVKGKTDGMIAAFATGITAVGSHTACYAIAQTGEQISVVTTLPLCQDAVQYFDRVGCVALQPKEADVAAAVSHTLTTALTEPFGEARIASTNRWRHYWASSDIVIEGNLDDQLGTRFSIYNLLIAASADDSRVSIAAKSLSGFGYRGMVFWDTDIHMTPFFNLTQPAMARNLALFRYHTLDGARAKAAKYGFRGASYPWETGVSGREETEKWLKLITHQAHITCDIAFALQQYVDCTGDDDFYVNHAAEVLIETARFWVSKAVQHGDAYAIPDAGGPDEFHVVSHDSAYVNNLTRLNLLNADRAVRYLADHAPEKLAEIKQRTGVTEEELASFATLGQQLRTMQDADGLFEQCRDFFTLRDEVLNDHENPLAEPYLTQTVKQADVLMFLYLLPDLCTAEVVRKNWDYYEPRTIHASSLSHAVHGILAAELGITEKADKYIRQSLGMDLHDEMNNTAAGAHMAANGMNWSAIVRGYGGTRPQGDCMLVNPHLPARWSQLTFNLLWRGANLTVNIRPDQVTVSNCDTAAAALPLRICGQEIVLQPGAYISHPLDPAMHLLTV